MDGADRSQQEMVVYYSYGMACAEAELDVLTGENVLRRADVLMDCGKRWLLGLICAISEFPFQDLLSAKRPTQRRFQYWLYFAKRCILSPR